MNGLCVLVSNFVFTVFIKALFSFFLLQKKIKNTHAANHMGGQTGITYKKNTHAANHMGGHTRITPLCERRKGTHAPKIASVVGQARYR